jgi:hypothetical protein
VLSFVDPVTPALLLPNFNYTQLCSGKDKHFSAFGGERDADCLGTRVSSANTNLCFLNKTSPKSPIKRSKQKKTITLKECGISVAEIEILHFLICTSLKYFEQKRMLSVSEIYLT